MIDPRSMSHSDVIVGGSKDGGDPPPINPNEMRAGLTTEEVEKLYEIHGFNELPHVEVSLLWLFFVQFTGLMPYMLEIACILALAVQDYIDFVIIIVIVMVNGCLGFTEELKAKASLDELTNKMEAKIAVLRDGRAENLLTRLLVPGDVILLVGGVAVPADVDWLDGDILSIDTAALTGEPLPRMYPSEEYGRTILCGTIVAGGEAYCIVRKTGINTEVGGAQAEIMKDKTETKVSVFEERVLLAVKVLIFISILDIIVIFFVLGVGRGFFSNSQGIHDVILTCLSIIIAAVPVALPLVLQVTMALGAGKMARDFSAVVTALPALQDISSMTVLCSDKTGTLTTAKMTVISDRLWCNEGFTTEDLALYGALGSNRDKKEDAIDRCVIGYFDKTASPANLKALKHYKKVRSVGFSPIYKRVLWEYTHPVLGRVTIAKGLANKVIDTADGSADDAADQWKVEGYATLLPKVLQVDLAMSKTGYKTLGVSVKLNDGPFKFVGILPMLDPPRHDTARTIENLVNAGIKVKMITGDHLNIAKETARLIGLGTNIQKGEETRMASQTTNDLIWNADGFAQVLPRDKREVVLVLKNTYHQVVGMTGDGVNDAPALSAAQCGVAVDDATDAAKNAAAIILTSPGLSAIYMAVVESRRIFRKLKSYVVYRFCATIQIVICLSTFIFASNCAIDSLFIILLALFNDLSLLPIAYDQQQASKAPENPNVTKLLLMSTALGFTQSGLTLMFGYGAEETGLFTGSNMDIRTCSTCAQASVWVQMFLSAEFVIFCTRTTGFAFVSQAPSPYLALSVFLFCLLVSLMSTISSYFGSLYVSDVCIIWCYCIGCFLVVDTMKIIITHLFADDPRVLDEEHIDQETISASAKEPSAKEGISRHPSELPDEENPAYEKVPREEDREVDRHTSMTQRMQPNFGQSSLSVHTAMTGAAEPTGIIGDSILSARRPSDISVLRKRETPSAATNADVGGGGIFVTRKPSDISVIALKTRKATDSSITLSGTPGAGGASGTAAPIVVSRRNTGNIMELLTQPVTTTATHAGQGASTDLRRNLTGGQLRPSTPANIMHSRR